MSLPFQYLVQESGKVLLKEAKEAGQTAVEVTPLDPLGEGETDGWADPVREECQGEYLFPNGQDDEFLMRALEISGKFRVARSPTANTFCLRIVGLATPPAVLNKLLSEGTGEAEGRGGGRLLVVTLKLLSEDEGAEGNVGGSGGGGREAKGSGRSG